MDKWLKPTEKWRYTCYGCMILLLVLPVMFFMVTEWEIPLWIDILTQSMALVLFLIGQTLRIVELRRERESITFNVMLMLLVSAGTISELIHLAHMC